MLIYWVGRPAKLHAFGVKSQILPVLHTQTFHTFLLVHAFPFQLLTIHFFKIVAVATQIHTF